MRVLDTAIVAALADGRLVRRDAIFVTARDRGDGSPHSAGFWTDFESVSFDVIDGLTGDTETRLFHAAGGLLSVGDIPFTSDLSIRQVDVTLSPLDATAETYLRTYDLRLAPIQIYRPIFDPDTFALVAEPQAVFVGTIEEAPITTPAEGGEAKAVLRCVSATAELTRASAELRSDESQKLRSGDRFFQYAATMPGRVVYWGQKPDKAA